MVVAQERLQSVRPRVGIAVVRRNARAFHHTRQEAQPLRIPDLKPPQVRAADVLYLRNQNVGRVGSDRLILEQAGTLSELAVNNRVAELLVKEAGLDNADRIQELLEQQIVVV